MGQFGPALFACKAPYQSTIYRRTEDLLLFEISFQNLYHDLGFKRARLEKINLRNGKNTCLMSAAIDLFIQVRWLLVHFT